MVTLIGDSLVSANPEVYAASLTRHGLTSSIESRGGRALRYGWQCRSKDGRLIVVSHPNSPRCRREGLTTLAHLTHTRELAQRVVLALGTNDAGLFRPEQISANLTEARRVVGSQRTLYLVSIARRGGSRQYTIYNDTARAWCAKDSRCEFVEWARSVEAQQPHSYTADGVHLQPAAVQARAQMIADTLTTKASASRSGGRARTSEVGAPQGLLRRS